MDAMAGNGEESFLAEALISHAIEALLLAHGLEATQGALRTLQGVHAAQEKPCLAEQEKPCLAEQEKPCPAERDEVAVASRPASSSGKLSETVGLSAGPRSRWADLEDDDE